LSDVKTNP